jgi:hypothetical protein
VTDDGVILFDAPESFGKNIPSAIAKVTDKPIHKPGRYSTQAQSTVLIS